jgi:hypothetical protein
MMGKARLWESVGLGLIVEWPSGVVFSNQTGGTTCLQPEFEGVFVPLRNDCQLPGERLLSPETELVAYFEGPKHRGAGAIRGLDEGDVQFIGSVLAKWRLGAFIAVDSSRLAESHEAWVHVIVGADDRAHELSLFEFAPYPRRGVLTWSNSD